MIVGGGAGGLGLAVRLAKNGQNGVLLIDRNDTHIWKPRIHELAAGLRRGYVDELGYAGLAEHWGFAFERGELCDVDTDTRHITLSEVRGRDGETLIEKRNIAYKALVLALGGVTPDMGVDGVSDHAFLLDSEEDAEILSRHFSSGLLAHSFSDHNQPYHLVIVGSGATGVELGGLLATDAVGASLAPRSSQPEVRITILEASDTFAPGIDDKVRHAIAERLKNAGVDIKTGQQVKRVSARAVETEGGEQYPADLTVWATGRVGPPVAGRINRLSSNKKRQWRVGRTLQSVNSEAVFALGDCAFVDDDPAPPTAQAASEQAEHLAIEVIQYLEGQQPAAFEFQDKGTLLSLGEAGSVGEIKVQLGDDLQIRGRLARAAYRGLQRQHQFLLLGAAKGTAETISDVFGRSIGPRLKIH